MLARQILRDDGWKVGAYTLILLGNLIGTILAFPTFEAKFHTVLSLVPDFLGSLKSALEFAGGAGLSGFLAINHFFKGVNVLGVAFAILLASGSIAREVELGTIGMLLSRPMGRTRVLASFVAIHLLELIIPLLIVTTLVPWLSPWLIGREAELAPLLAGAAHASAFLVLVYAMSMVISIWIAEQLKVAAIAGGIGVASFIAYFIDQTKDLSLYRLSSIERYAAIARGDGIDWPVTGSALGASAILLVYAFHRFRRNDY